MKQITIILILTICSNSTFAKTIDNGNRNSIGVLFSPGYISSNYQVYGLGLRGTHAVNKVFSYGAELSYQYTLGTYGNLDAMGGIGFGRISPFKKGPFAEFGAQAITVTSAARSGSSKYVSPYLSFGYQAKIFKRISAQFQVRPITFNGSKFEMNESPGRTNLLQKVYLGLNYSF